VKSRFAGVEPDQVKTILVALDGSRFSERALLAAAPLAVPLHAHLFMFSAVRSEQEADERITRISQLRPRGLPTTIDVLPDPDPAEAIDIVLHDLRDAIACLASHGRGRSAAILGSVTTEVIRRCRRPTIVVGPEFSNQRLGKGVVACVDENPESADVMPVAAHWAEMLDSKLRMVTVAELVPPPLAAGPVRRHFGPDGDVDQYLDALATPWRSRSLEFETEAVYDAVGPATGLREYLWEHPATLVVLSSRIRHGLRHPVLGSTAAAIIRHSFAPTLVVPRETPV
jgi:nucleotide-binding universal stress UspA family protein